MSRQAPELSITRNRLIGRPSVRDDRLKVGRFRAPTQDLPGAFAGGDCRRWVSGPATGVANFKIDSGNPFHGIDHLPIGGSDARSQVECQVRVPVKRFNRQHVSFGEIAHVYVVTNTSPVERRVVITKDVEVVAASGGDVKSDRDQVYLRAMPFGMCQRAPRPAGTLHAVDPARPANEDLLRPSTWTGRRDYGDAWPDFRQSACQSGRRRRHTTMRKRIVPRPIERVRRSGES